jgi:beta-lactamase regulating signal transducer with metallopeptidase domain
LTLLVTWLWQGLAIAALAELVIRTVPRQAARRRHLVWWTALAAVLAIPVTGAFPLPLHTAPTAALLLVPGEIVTASTAEALPSALLVLTAPPDWLLWSALVAWTIAVVAGVARAAHGWIAVQRAVASARPLGPREARLATWSQLRDTGRRPVLRVSSETRGACAVGLRRPTVLVSATLAESIDDERLEHVVLHEFAHLERYDDWWTLVQRGIRVAAGFHPAVHWICRRIDLEMEAACDERVVARTGDALAYARSLLDVAVLSASTAGLRPAVAPGASVHMPILRTRIERLAAATRPRGVVAATASFACIVLLAGAVVSAATAPALVRFDAPTALTYPTVPPPRPDASPGLLVRAGSGDTEQVGTPLTRRALSAAESAEAPLGRAAARVVAPPLLEARRDDAIRVAVDPVQTRNPADHGGSAVESQPADMLVARELTTTWRLPEVGSPLEQAAPGMPVANAAQRSAAGITRAAQSTAGAFTRFGQAVASRF